jgi:hypothetical protein
MQRYEREIEAILRDLEAQEDSTSVSHNVKSRPRPPEKFAREAWWLRDASLVSSRARPSGDKFVAIACPLLVAAILVLPYLSLLSCGLITFSLVLLVLSRKRGRVVEPVEDGLAARDLRWTDVIVRPRPGKPGTSGTKGAPPKPENFRFWS